jgi:hypothetical protein
LTVAQYRKLQNDLKIDMKNINDDKVIPDKPKASNDKFLRPRFWDDAIPSVGDGADNEYETILNIGDNTDDESDGYIVNG